MKPIQSGGFFHSAARLRFVSARLANSINRCSATICERWIISRCILVTCSRLDTRVFSGEIASSCVVENQKCFKWFSSIKLRKSRLNRHDLALWSVKNLKSNQYHRAKLCLKTKSHLECWVFILWTLPLAAVYCFNNTRESTKITLNWTSIVP